MSDTSARLNPTEDIILRITCFRSISSVELPIYKVMDGMKTGFSPLEFERLSQEDQLRRSNDFLKLMNKRRSVREFSEEEVPIQLLKNCLRAAMLAPSGANKQPWHFVLISDPMTKRRIRIAAEKEEKINYEGGRLPEHWREDVEKLGTDWQKPYIEKAPYLIAVFAIFKRPFYYVMESVGIAVGMLITALHHAGLATLPHTPNPMRFLGEILNRPVEEKAIMLLPVGYPADGAVVPEILRKPETEVLSINPVAEGFRGVSGELEDD